MKHTTWVLSDVISAKGGALGDAKAALSDESRTREYVQKVGLPEKSLAETLVVRFPRKSL